MYRTPAMTSANSANQTGAPPELRYSRIFQPADEKVRAIIQLPSFEKATAGIGTLEWIQSLKGCAVRVSQIRTCVGVAVLVTTRNPSGLNRTQLTAASWTIGSPTARSVRASQRRADLSSEAVAIMS